MVSGNVYHVEREGPSTPEELPFDVTTSDNIEGLRRFRLRGSPGNGAAMGGSITPIYFVDEHDRECVIRAFLDANPGLVEAKSRKGLVQAIRAHGRSWQQAARPILGEYYDDANESAQPPNEGYKGGTKECGLCGEKVKKNQYPTHLADDCEAVY